MFKLFKDQRLVCHTAEFLLQEEPEVVSSPRVREQLPEAERPPLHPHLCWRFHTVPTTSEESTGGLNPSGKSAGSLGHAEGPVCDVISQPGVAGETAGQEGVVAAVGGAVLHDPGKHKRRASARLEQHIYLKCASAPRDCVARRGGNEALDRDKRALPGYTPSTSIKLINKSQTCTSAGLWGRQKCLGAVVELHRSLIKFKVTSPAAAFMHHK